MFRLLLSIMFALCTFAAAVSAQVFIAPEDRCAPYDRDDYPYPASIEAEIVSQNLGGVIYSPYTNEMFSSTSETDIEHIVAAAEAHDSGMCAMSANTKKTFARDLDNLTLASPSVNRYQKSDKDIAEWKPEENLCWYANTILHVKSKYRLTMDSVEAEAMLNVIADCNSGMVAESPVMVETETPEIDALALYDDNGNGKITCSEAKAHGIAPVYRGDPAYPYMNDGNDDGVVCG